MVRYPKKCFGCPYRNGDFCSKISKTCNGECKLKVYVIGSMTCADKIEETAQMYRDFGHSVKYAYPRPEVCLDILIMESFQNIAESNLVVAVAKEDKTYGTGTLYEMGFAQFLSKPIVKIVGW